MFFSGQAGLLAVGDQTYWFGTKRHGHPNVAPHGTYPPYSAYCYPPQPDPAGGDTSEGSRLGVGDGFTEGVNAYIADRDLYNWKPLGLVFAANKTGAHCLERPKVILCPATKKYVLWAKGFRPMPSNDKLAVVATSDTPQGPYELVDPAEPFQLLGGYGMADATVYVDEQRGGAWLFWRQNGHPAPVLPDGKNGTSGMLAALLTAPPWLSLRVEDSSSE